MKLFEMTPLEAAGTVLAWGAVAFLVLVIVIILAVVARAGYIAFTNTGNDNDGGR